MFVETLIGQVETIKVIIINDDSKKKEKKFLDFHNFEI